MNNIHTSRKPQAASRKPQANTISVWRLLLILAFFVSLCTSTLAQPDRVSSDCRSEEVPCSGDWQYNDFTVTVPDFPTCPLTIRYRVRDCGSNTFYYQLMDIRWQVPDLSNPNDPSNPCHDLHYAYSTSFDQDQFLQSLFHAALKRLARLLFDQKLVLAQNDLAQDPNNPLLQAKYQVFLCPNGQKVFRATYATCMSAVRGEFPLQGGYRTDTTNSKGSASFSRVDTAYFAQPLQIHIKYYACNADAVCCLREFKICYNEATQFTRTYWKTTPPADMDLCPLNPPDVDVIQQSNPGFHVGRCLPYCDAGEYTPPPMIESEDPLTPDISKK